MTKLEHFSAWAESHFPWIVAIADESNRKVFFHDKSLQMAWMAFQHAFTVRPTTDTRLNSAEFMKDDPATIVDRLNGVFPTADPPYKMSPLHYEAAREIERLRESLDGVTVTTNTLGEAVAVTITDREFRIKEVIWRKEKPAEAG